MALVLLRFRDFHLVEIAGALELGDETGHGIQRISLAVHLERIAAAFEAVHPKGIDAIDGIGDGVEQFLAAGTVPLELFDNVYALLEGGFFLLAALDFSLNTLKAGAFGSLRLDLGFEFDEFAVHLAVVEKQGAKAEYDGDKKSDNGEGGVGRGATSPRFLGPRLTEKVDPYHGVSKLLRASPTEMAKRGAISRN